MLNEFDCRDFRHSRIDPVREKKLFDLAVNISKETNEHEVMIEQFDATTGNPSVVSSKSSVEEKGDYVQRALRHIGEYKGVLGLEDSQPPEYVVDPTKAESDHYQETSSRGKVVHLLQQYKGIDIFQAATNVLFSPDDKTTTFSGNNVTVSRDLEVSPKLSAREAVFKAVEIVTRASAAEQKDQFGQVIKHRQIDLESFNPEVIQSSSEIPSLLTTFKADPFGEVKTSLIWFAKTKSEINLGWEVILPMPNHEGRYRVILDAKSGDILYSRQLVAYAKVQGRVFLRDGDSARELVEFPRSLQEYPIDPPPNLPDPYPDPWVGSNCTEGNCVYAHLADSNSPLQAALLQNDLLFDPTDGSGPEQMVLNIFYFNAYLHDFFYMLGFRERDGNFQKDNLGRGGLPDDRVDARAHPGSVYGTANMDADHEDGKSPVMNMGTVTIQNGDGSQTIRHTAFDPTVLIHEYTHGVTQRLVGGKFDKRALESPQSAGMGEGWGDYFACTLMKTNVLGAWVSGKPEGIRKFKYDKNFPDNFGMLGTGRYAEFIDAFGIRRVPVHNIGEIWCATLIEMNDKIGEKLAMQLVVDALKLSPTNPSFINMRESILKALDFELDAGQLEPDEHRKSHRGIWEAFSKYGMGPGSRSNGAQLSGIVGDFNLPPLPPS